jgi:hypothetical protein
LFVDDQAKPAKRTECSPVTRDKSDEILRGIDLEGRNVPSELERSSSATWVKTAD